MHIDDKLDLACAIFEAILNAFVPERYHEQMKEDFWCEIKPLVEKTLTITLLDNSSNLWYNKYIK